MSRRHEFPIPGEVYESISGKEISVIRVGMFEDKLTVWYEEELRVHRVAINDPDEGWFCRIKEGDYYEQNNPVSNR